MLIAPWDEYCRKHWEHPRVIRFLDRCAYLLLRDGPGDTLTDYKVMMQGRREISESSCPSDIQDLFYAGAPVLRSAAGEERAAFKQMFSETTLRPKESRPHDGRFERLTRAGSLFPDGEIEVSIVDTENCFIWADRKYRISREARQYEPVHTRSGDYYALDKILILHHGEEIFCF